MDTVGQRIKRIRKYRKMTQIELAEKSGIHVVSIRNYELDNKTPRPEHLQRVADALEVDIAFLSPVKLGTDKALLALFFSLADEYDDIVMERRGKTIQFSKKQTDDLEDPDILTKVYAAYRQLPRDEFLVWLTEYPNVHKNVELPKWGRKSKDPLPTVSD